MTGSQVTAEGDGPVSGRCTECGETWIGFGREVFTSRASRHITRNHSDADPDEPIVVEFDLLGGGDP